MSKTTKENQVICEVCLKDFSPTEKNTFKGKQGQTSYFCDNCVEKINQTFEEETKDSNLFGAFSLGLAAAAVGGIAWFAVAAITGWTLGFLAIGVGWLVGNAVIRGAGSKRGQNLQILSLVLTLIAIVIAELFVFGYYGSQELSKMFGESISIMNVIGVTLLDYSELGASFRKIFAETVISPVGLFIWGIGLYQGFMIPKARKLV